MKYTVIGVDVGGTFTDFFVFTRDGLKTFKLLSTPDDPSKAVLDGLKDLEGRIIHGSTVATNAFLERKGARVLFITTHGFEDIIFIGRQTRERIYDLFYRRPAPPIKSDMVVGIRERINAKGEVVTPISGNDLDRLKDIIHEKKPESIAVGFLFSFLNKRHEEMVKEALYPLSKYIFLSSEVVPEYREYERFITTVINAYLSPVVTGYIKKLKKSLKNVWIMSSGGGIISTDEASERPIGMILSGPVGGVIASKFYGDKVGEGKLISFDMGGTSTDVSLIDGSFSITKEKVIDGFPIRIATVDVHTIGAGGGSIAYLDIGGALKVGPRSAGADPGPICYGRGGKEPTVTDANLLLGRIPRDVLLAGKYKLDYGKTLAVFEEKASLWGFDSPFSLAKGIVDVVNMNMERALKAVSMERGYDPGDFSLIAFGGSGPLHACELARSLGIRKVIVPPYPGVFSAFGMVFTDWVVERAKTFITGKEGLSELERLIEELKGSVRKEFERGGVYDISFDVFFEARYKGQSYEIRVPWNGDWDVFENDFKRMHEGLYGYSFEGPLEVVNVVVRGIVEGVKAELPRLPEKGRVYISKAKVFIGNSLTDIPLVDRSSLYAGFSMEGPSIFIEKNSTFYLPEGWRISVDSFGGLHAESCKT